MTSSISTVAYIGATILFILCLGGLSNPETSRRGNLYGIVGMTIAVLATVFGPRVSAAGMPWIVGAMVAGAAVGLVAARKVQMTQMPELVAAALFWFVGANAPAAFLGHFTVFVLACFVGYMVIWNVTPALHTPLMSVTNAISSIIAIGALVQVAPFEQAVEAGRPTAWIIGLAVTSIALVAINMFGGFAVTQRMLDMFRK